MYKDLLNKINSYIKKKLIVYKYFFLAYLDIPYTRISFVI